VLRSESAVPAGSAFHRIRALRSISILPADWIETANAEVRPKSKNTIAQEYGPCETSGRYHVSRRREDRE